MRTLTGIVAVLLIQLVAACDKPSPVAPGPPAPPLAPAPAAPPAVNGEKWDLATAITSITGPKECVAAGTYDPAIDVSHSLLTIERSGDSMHLITSSIGNPADAYEYTVIVAGTDFSGSGATIPSGYLGYFMCGQSGRDYVYRGEAYLGGRFSADEKTLTADQELVFQLTSGNVITYHFAWTATRQ
jgi:hypothetical protein